VTPKFRSEVLDAMSAIFWERILHKSK